MKVLVSDELWAAVEPLLPPPKPRRPDHPGRKPLDRRKVLGGILYVLKGGIAWEDLPAELGLGHGSVVPAHPREREHQERQEPGRDPRPVHKLGDEHDRQGGGELPSAAAGLPPGRDHPALGQGECEKGPDREQGDQVVRDAVERDQQDGRDDG